MVVIVVKPAGDNGVVANPVILQDYKREITRSDSAFRRIYDMERGSTKVGFEYDLEPVKLGIIAFKKHVEIKRCRSEIPGMKRFQFHRSRMVYNGIRDWNCKEWRYMSGHVNVVRNIWRLRLLLLDI